MLNTKKLADKLVKILNKQRQAEATLNQVKADKLSQEFMRICNDLSEEGCMYLDVNHNGYWKLLNTTSYQFE